MSLNDTYEALRGFERELRSFDEAVTSGHKEIKRRQDAIDGLWRDALRAQYDKQIGAFEQHIEHYTSGRSEAFETFLQTKLAQLNHYLHGS